MSEKYYKPTIDEFHIDFEFEFETGIEGWKKFILQNDRVDSTLKNVKEFSTQFRVKLLDEEDIKELFTPLGFKHEEEKYSSHTVCKYIRGSIWKEAIVISLFKNGEVKITKYDFKGENNPDSYFTIFWGIPKNKSELNRLIKQLNII